MILEEEKISKIRRIFDLNLYEAKLWTALLARGVSTAGELSKIADVPRSRAYDVLESLEDRGFIVMKLEKPIKYIALSPEEVTERRKGEIMQQAREESQQLEEVKDKGIYNNLHDLYESGLEYIEPSEISGAIKGRKNILKQINKLIRDAKSEIKIMTTEDELARHEEDLKKAFEKAKEKGIKVKVAAPISDSELVEDLEDLAEIRKVDDVKGRFYVRDSKETLMMTMDGEEVNPMYDTGLWVDSDFMGESLGKIFEKIWAHGKQL